MGEYETVFYKSAKNNNWKKTDVVKVPNRGMNFGDGIFETMVLDQGKIRFSEMHEQRFSHGLDVLRLESKGVDFNGLQGFLQDVFPTGTHRVRWNLYRAGSGKYTPTTNHVAELLQVSDFRSAPQVKPRCRVSESVRLSFSPWSECKTLNALPYVMAGMEKERLGLDELILLDHRGYLSEASSSNLFWRKGDQFYTPALSCGCINGVGRRLIFSVFKKAGIQCAEGEFFPDELKNSDQVLVTNVTGISYLSQFENEEYSTIPHPVLLSLFE